MTRNIWVGVVVVIVLVAGGWWYFNQSSAPATSETAQLPMEQTTQQNTKPLPVPSSGPEYVIRLGDQQVGSVVTTVSYVRLAQPGYVWLLVPDTSESNYSLGVSSLLSAGEHYNVTISHRDPEVDAYRSGEQVTARLYIDNGSKVGTLDLDDDVIRTTNGEPLVDTVTVN